MDIRAKHALEIRGLRTKPGAVLTNHDLFDRMLIAHAKSEKHVLFSHDRNFLYYGEDLSTMSDAKRFIK